LENTRIGPFLIGRRLGRTRRQQVFLATHTEQKRQVALKFISIPASSDWNSVVAKINLEAALLKDLQHPQMARVYGAGVAEHRVFFAYELVEGESLEQLLARRGRLATDQAVDVARQIAQALEYLHEQHLLHGKLVPRKAMVRPDGTLKILGLRLNREGRRRWDAPTRYSLETAAYLAPEVFRGGAKPHPKNDFYSLGTILFEMLTGELPFTPDNLSRLIKKKRELEPPQVSQQVLNCPFWLDRVVSQLMQPQPELRMHSAKAVSLALDQVKRIDANAQSAAEQMAGGFSPLTAGLDKSEARRALGQAPPPPEKRSQSPRQPLVRSSGLILAALLLIAVIFGLALRPTSPEKLLNDAKQLLESESASDWVQAQRILKKVMERATDPDLLGEADQLYRLSKRDSMLRRLDRGRFLQLEHPLIQRFNEGYTAEKAGDDQQALLVYQSIIAETGAADQLAYVVDECIDRVRVLRSKTDSTDAGSPDAGSPDAGSPDAGSPDTPPNSSDPNPPNSDE